MLNNQWFPFFGSWIVSIITTPIAIWLMWKWRAIDDPLKHKHAKVVHTYPVPRGGGLPIFVALFVGTFLFLPIDKHSFAILTASLFTLVIGLLDDRYDLSPYLRLLTNFLAAVIIISQGILINYVTNPITGNIINFSTQNVHVHVNKFNFEIPYLSILITIIWIVGLMNMIGQGAGGIDGQLPGVIVIASWVIAVMSNIFSADITLWPVSTLALIVSGSYLGFLPWNFFPQKIMPGYSGKSLAGLLLAVMAILSTAKIGLLIIVLGIPLIDTGLTYLRRLWMRKSPLLGDRGHLHHRFLDAGYNKPTIVMIYWVLTGILGFIALQINSRQKLYALLLVALSVFFLLLVLKRPRSSTSD